MQAAGLTRSMSKKDVHRTMQLAKDFREIKERNVLWALVVGVSMDDFINEINSYISGIIQNESSSHWAI